MLDDLTNTYSKGQAKQNPKVHFGMSKEKRKDCPLVTRWLDLNQQGFLGRSKFLAGNVNESTSLKNALEALHVKENLFQP
jgi:hypothetical protein